MGRLILSLSIVLALGALASGGKKGTGSASSQSAKSSVDPQKDPLVVVQKINKPVALKVGQASSFEVFVDVVKGFHVQSNPAKPRLIPTTLKFSGSEGITIQKTNYPKGKPYRLKGASDSISVYEDTFKIEVIAMVKKGTKPGASTLKGKLRYQACNDVTCFFPKSVAVLVPIKVSK